MSRHEQYGPDCRDFRNSMKDSLLLKEMYFSKRITLDFFLNVKLISCKSLHYDSVST